MQRSVFRKKFNHFYRVRQKPAEWYDAYYKTMDKARKENLSFEDVLRMICEKTGEYEQNF